MWQYSACYFRLDLLQDEILIFFMSMIPTSIFCLYQPNLCWYATSYFVSMCKYDQYISKLVYTRRKKSFITLNVSQCNISFSAIWTFRLVLLLWHCGTMHRQLETQGFVRQYANVWAYTDQQSVGLYCRKWQNCKILSLKRQWHGIGTNFSFINLYCTCATGWPHRALEYKLISIHITPW